MEYYILKKSDCETYLIKNDIINDLIVKKLSQYGT